MTRGPIEQVELERTIADLRDAAADLEQWPQMDNFGYAEARIEAGDAERYARAVRAAADHLEDIR